MYHTLNDEVQPLYPLVPASLTSQVRLAIIQLEKRVSPSGKAVASQATITWVRIPSPALQRQGIRLVIFLFERLKSWQQILHHNLQG